MNYFNPQNQTPTRSSSNVISDSGIRVVGESTLLSTSLCSTYSPSVACADMFSVICNIMGFGKQAKAWMLRKNATVGWRMKFS